MSPAEDLDPVRLLGIPVAVHARAREHNDALMREFRLIAEQMKGPDAAAVPSRLADLVRTLGAGYSGISVEQEDALDAAIESGRATIDLTFTVPAGAADAARSLGSLLDEADEYCRAGQHLLTLATPAELVAYRRWYLGQFTGQIDGAAPVSWLASDEVTSG